MPCKRLLWANTRVKWITPFQKGLNMVFHKTYYRALYLIITYWGVIVHFVIEAKFLFFITWLVFLNWLRCQKEYFPSLFLLFSSNINIIKSSRMHPFSRNKQKPITVNPEGSLWWRKPRKAERKLNEYLCLYLFSLPSFLGSYFHRPIWILSCPGGEEEFLSSAHDWCAEMYAV